MIGGLIVKWSTIVVDKFVCVIIAKGDTVYVKKKVKNVCEKKDQII